MEVTDTCSGLDCIIALVNGTLNSPEAFWAMISSIAILIGCITLAIEIRRLIRETGLFQVDVLNELTNLLSGVDYANSMTTISEYETTYLDKNAHKAISEVLDGIEPIVIKIKLAHSKKECYGLFISQRKTLSSLAKVLIRIRGNSKDMGAITRYLAYHPHSRDILNIVHNWDIRQVKKETRRFLRRQRVDNLRGWLGAIYASIIRNEESLDDWKTLIEINKEITENVKRELRGLKRTSL